jgi:quinol-cytochrome oxidoreductase complex cytochrome b subunit
MSVLLEIHLVVAFLLALCAIIFSWNAPGRRVVNAIAGLQFIVGLIVAGMFGSSHTPLPPQVWLHIVAAILILACYGMAMRFGKRAGGSGTALGFSIAGLILIFYNIYLGWSMAGGVTKL